MYVYRVYNRKTGTFVKNHNNGHSMWLRERDAIRQKPSYPKHMADLYEVKKYELVEVPCED